MTPQQEKRVAWTRERLRVGGVPMNWSIARGELTFLLDLVEELQRKLEGAVECVVDLVPLRAGNRTPAPSHSNSSTGARLVLTLPDPDSGMRLVQLTEEIL